MLGAAQESQPPQHFATPQLRDAQGSTIEILHDPPALTRQLQKRSTQCTAEMVAALAPVEAAEREAAPHGVCGLKIDAERAESARTAAAQLVDLVAAAGMRGKPAEAREALAQRHTDGAGDVIVAGGRRTQMVRRRTDERLPAT